MQNLPKLIKHNKKSFFLLLWMSIVPLFISSTITIIAVQYEHEISTFPYEQWALFFFASILSMAFAFTPTTFIALFTGYFLGMKALPYMLISYLIASLLGYKLANLLDRGEFFQSLDGFPKAKKLIEGLNEKQTSIIILTRISPVLPFAIMNVVLSIIGVKLRPFLIAGFIGMLPRTLLFTWLGNSGRGLRELLEEGIQKDNLMQFITLTLIFISVAGIIYYIRKIFKEKIDF